MFRAFFGHYVSYPAAKKPGLVDALIADYHDALLDRLELRINEVARDIAS